MVKFLVLPSFKTDIRKIYLSFLPGNKKETAATNGDGEKRNQGPPEEFQRMKLVGPTKTKTRSPGAIRIKW
ncbi:hypothetical protein AVEN_72292-1 [Araneus ventricosus]|uniref:Uncharacterized protein n=1 Tax=Araneus ventricosus TaxID=182803 RepID=A0A4Y2TB02_ARAVE|nr:hypothetical protein AVEN_72292-1 [Araneus ventricosus]